MVLQTGSCFRSKKSYCGEMETREMIEIEDVTGTKGMWKASKMEKTENLLQQIHCLQTGME